MRRAGPIAAVAAATLIAAAVAARAAGNAFVDPLDAPARPTALAAGTLLASVARAGARLVAVGSRGHVLFSDDRGASWTQAAVPVSTDLTAVTFVSRERGWAVGHDGVVLSTRDGGGSWTLQLDGRRLRALLQRTYAGAARGPIAAALSVLEAEEADRSFLDVWFDDERTGFAVGAFALLVRTDDGGETWTPWLDREDNPRARHLYAIRRAGGALWAAGEQGLVLRLDPVARRFRAVAVPYDGTLFGLAAAGRSVLGFGLRGHVIRLDPGGRWHASTSGADSALTGSATLPDGRLVLVSQTGELLVSGDEGATFRRAGGGPPAAAAAALAGDEVAVVGPAGAHVVRLRP